LRFTDIIGGWLVLIDSGENICSPRIYFILTLWPFRGIFEGKDAITIDEENIYELFSQRM